MKKKLVIAIDCDDVLITTSPHLVDYYNKTYGTALELRHIYNGAELKAWGTDRQEVAVSRIQDFSLTDEHAAIQPDAKSIVAVKELARHHELHLVTGRAAFLEPVTRRMLDEYFPDCFQTVEHTSYLDPSTDVALQRTKGGVCRAIGADILIDDHVKHGETAIGIVGEVIVFGEYPWNQREVLPEGMVRCADWEAVVAEVEEYAARQ
jgi:5'(3')-deoxyribonucleotidase